jgi:hypothetical protein
MAVIKKHSWISTRADSLSQLLLEDCISEEQQSLISDLLARFKYVSALNFGEKINDLALEIVTTPNLAPEKTIIAAMAADSTPDSSQALVQMIKLKLQSNGWGNVHIVNLFGAAFKKSKSENFERINIVLVDEFVGSGRTVIGRVSAIKSQFKTANIDVNIFVNVIYSSIVGVEEIKKNTINFSCLETIPRGISDFEKPEEIASKIEEMISLEKKLSSEHGKFKREDYSLGYGKTESLFGIENGNIPNNVFPIFWWPKNSKGEDRNPLFHRYLGD